MVYYYGGKRFKKLFDQKDVSVPRKLCSFLKKNDFISENMKNTLSPKMALKSSYIEAFSQELWAI